MFKPEDKDRFFNAIESLKKYRRADLLDERGRNLLEKLYTDLLPNDHILNKSIKENTTFLIGRKGTGKSTIFLRIEQELRKKDNYLPCYLDVKTIYESAQTDYINIDYISEYLPEKTFRKYLIERSFLQMVLRRIAEEINLRFDNWFEKLKAALGVKTAEEIKQKIQGLKNQIEDNEILKEIEIPVIKTISTKKKTFDESKFGSEDKKSGSIAFGIKATGPSAKVKIGKDSTESDNSTSSEELEENFSSAFLQIFQIKSYIEELKEILKTINIRHIVILLDDFSEIDDFAIKTFVDVILAPLNNWSDEFIKFKVAAYPNRIYYGKIDLGKIDTINLDFYNLYSEFDRNKMEEGAIDFTRRLIERRVNHYVGRDPSFFFDTTRLTMIEFYEVLFQTSMNVPRIIGYILSYCYQSKTIYDKLINKQDIESAAKRYYDDKIEPFFHKTTFSLLSIDEKINNLQLRDLLNRFVEKMVETKKKISTGEYSGAAYSPSYPYTSHFHFTTSLENFLKTLELNFFITKYAELSDKDGQISSVFCLNYGLCQKNNLLWGRTKHRKYFIERPFNFFQLIRDFLATSKSIHCSNEDCNQVFNQDQLSLLEFANFRCNKCGGKVIIEAISEDIKNKLTKIEHENLLSTSEVEIVLELSKQGEALTAKEISEELDISKYSIAQRSRKLDLQKGLLRRNRGSGSYTYELTDKAKSIYRE